LKKDSDLGSVVWDGGRRAVEAGVQGFLVMLGGVLEGANHLAAEQAA